MSRDPFFKPYTPVLETVPADGQTAIHLRGLALGSRVVVEGPDPDAFEVSGEALALAFVVPGRYRIIVRAPDGRVVDRIETEVTSPAAA